MSTDNIDKIYYVRAGKFRRYPKDGWRQIYDFKTFALNFRDIFLVIIGIIQSFYILRKIKPDILFSRGGYVSVPVCLGAKLAKINYITHDSDMVPSLANRIVGGWAIANFISGPKEYYKYAPDKMILTGIPIDEKFKPLSTVQNKEYREELQLDSKEKLLLVVGGGLGAKDLNSVVIRASEDLFEDIRDLRIIIISGNISIDHLKSEVDRYISVKYRKFVRFIEYTKELYKYSGVADLIITRAGATSLAEFSAQHKPLIVIPSSFLASGHQIKNAEVLRTKKAIEYIKDTDLKDNIDILKNKILELIKDPKKLKELSDNIASVNNFDSVELVSSKIIQLANLKGNKNK